MTTGVQDKIERIMVLPVSRERAWAAITEPNQITRWFGDSVEMALEPGAPILFGWKDYGQVRGRVERVEPPRQFAYRWTQGSDPDHSVPFGELPTTLVEFTLNETPEGTRLTLIESGFASLPEELRAKSYGDNSGGWTEELGHLVTYLESLVTA
jgi:uncharacterized protein YndB with AHSA1/START domain